MRAPLRACTTHHSADLPQPSHRHGRRPTALGRATQLPGRPERPGSMFLQVRDQVPRLAPGSGDLLVSQSWLQRTGPLGQPSPCVSGSGASLVPATSVHPLRQAVGVLKHAPSALRRTATGSPQSRGHPEASRWYRDTIQRALLITLPLRLVNLRKGLHD